MITLLGATGYVGNEFQRYFETHNIPYTPLSRSQVDYTSLKILSQWLATHKPEFLINAAGYTGKPNVDTCENDKAVCLMGNAVLPGVIAKSCEENGIPWGHVSSGCIYNGNNGGKGFKETDPPNFSFRNGRCSFYSGTKALGEEILAEQNNVYIWRLRIPFNHLPSKRNYLSKILSYERLLDVENSLSHLDDFVEACVACWEKQAPYGTYNLTNPGSVTTREVVEMMKRYGLTEKEFSFFKDEGEFMQTAAITPRSNCVLNTEKQKDAGIEMRDIHSALSESLIKWC